MAKRQRGSPLDCSSIHNLLGSVFGYLSHREKIGHMNLVCKTWNKSVPDWTHLDLTSLLLDSEDYTSSILFGDSSHFFTQCGPTMTRLDHFRLHRIVSLTASLPILVQFSAILDRFPNITTLLLQEDEETPPPLSLDQMDNHQLHNWNCFWDKINRFTADWSRVLFPPNAQEIHLNECDMASFQSGYQSNLPRLRKLNLSYCMTKTTLPSTLEFLGQNITDLSYSSRSADCIQLLGDLRICVDVILSSRKFV